MVKVIPSFVLACVVVLGFTGASSAQDIGNVAGGLEQTRLQINRLGLKLGESRISTELDMISLCNQEIQLVGRKKADEKWLKSADQLLSASEVMLPFAPKVYGQEVRPVLVASFKGEVLPKKLTKIQTRIVLAGGGALLSGIDQLISNATQVPVYIADDPLVCVVKGAGAALENLDVYKRSILLTK